MKKSLAFLSGICLALSSGLASAVTLNGWNVGNPTPVGATGLVNAAKNVGGVAKVSNASIVPNASQVSKILRGGVAGVALTVAVNELLDGIDWVMDPANNQIRYKVPDNSQSTTPQVYSLGGMYPFDLKKGGKYEYAYSVTPQGACDFALLNYPQLSAYEVRFVELDGYVGGCSHVGAGIIQHVYRIDNPNFGDSFDVDKTLPLDTVSQKVIDKAETGNTDAQVATVAAAQNILNDAQNDAEKAKPIVQQLEANAIIAGNALYPNKISHDREDEIRQMKPNDPCDEISQAIKDLEETVKWRKSDLNPNDKGTKKYVGHQKRIKILNDKKDDLKRAYTVWCEGN